MELRHLRYFVAVADALSFTRAAERLHIGQPPLSMQIRDLEGELGAQLFVRSGRRIALTEAGQRFLVHARAILARSGQAIDEARRAGRGEAGVLRVGFTSSLPYSGVFASLLSAFRQRHPAVALQLCERFTTEQFHALAEGTLDVGLVRVAGAPAGLALREIGRDPLRLVIHRDHPLASRRTLAFAELAGEGFITFPPGTGTELPDRLHALAAAAGFVPRIVQTAREATTQIGLVAAGLGLALLPAPLACVRIAQVRYRPVRDAGADFPLALAWCERNPSPVRQRFLALAGVGPAPDPAPAGAG